MISSIPANDSLGHDATEQTGDIRKVTTHTQIPSTQQPKMTTKQDHVTLSHSARARLLKNKGYSIQQIALMMNSDIHTVTGYIG